MENSHALKLIRTFSGMTQEALAAALRTDQSEISKWERDERVIPSHYLPHIKDVAKSAIADVDAEKATIKNLVRSL